MSSIKKYIPTVLITLIVQVVNWLVIMFNIGVDIINAYILIFILCPVTWVTFHRIVTMRNKKITRDQPDKWEASLKERRIRVIISFIIQMVTVFIFILRPYIPMKHYDGIEKPTAGIFLPLVWLLIEPIVNFIWCALFDLVLAELPIKIFKLIKQLKKSTATESSAG